MLDAPLLPGEPPRLRDGEIRWFEPVCTASNEDEPAAPSASSLQCADAGPNDDVRWIGFGSSVDLAEPIAPEEIGDPRPEHAGAPAALEPGAEMSPRRAPIRVLRRSLRFAAAAIGVAVLAVLVYNGGEQLARLTGARQQPAAPAAPTITPPPPASATVAAAPKIVPPPTGPAARYVARAEAGGPKAQYDLAVLYARGDGVAQNYAAAATWFRKAALAGNLSAAFDLGVLYQRGLGLEHNADEAVRWYRRAAAGNYPAAQYNLALAYADGSGTPQDWVAAASWYHQAALRGVVPAMVNFAILYERGDGVERSLPDAYAWYRAAARRGDAVAEERAREVFDQLAGPAKGRAVMLAAGVVDALRERAPTTAPPPPPGAARLLPSGGWNGGTLGSDRGPRHPPG